MNYGTPPRCPLPNGAPTWLRHLAQHLHAGGSKADVSPNKIIVGRGVLGAPIILAPPNDLLGLALTEDAEDAVSVHEAAGLGAWAGGWATRMPALGTTVSRWVVCITVIGHDDAGARRATDLATRLRAPEFAVSLKFSTRRPRQERRPRRYCARAPPRTREPAGGELAGSRALH
jgi:hypothetical protein